MTDVVVGIDLGTTYSEIAVVEDGRPRLLGTDDERILPSVVGLGPDERLLVGRPAKNQWVAAPDRTVRSIKRQMGTDSTVTLGERSFHPEEISACILRRLAEVAERAGISPVKRAVITVPAWFNEAQRQATRLAGDMAGLEVVRLLNEPTAAALAYGLGRSTDEMLLVYDLGGGTFDVSIVEACGGVMEVRASRGDVSLGGDDWDERLARWLAENFQSRHGIDLMASPRSRARLLQAAEGAKRALSTQPYTAVREEFIAQKDGLPLHLEQEVSREKFEALTADLLERTADCVRQALSDAGLKPEAIHQVLLAGGSTRMPAVHHLVHQLVDREPLHFVSPDEVVALGAAVQGAILEGQDVDAVLVDISAHALGIGAQRVSLDGLDDVYSILIPRQTALPARRSKIFYAFPGQHEVVVEIFQGEAPVLEDNQSLGEMRLELPADSGLNFRELTVEFGLNLDGLLEVTCAPRGTGRRESLELQTENVKASRDVAASRARVHALMTGSEQPAVAGMSLSSEHRALVDMAEQAMATAGPAAAALRTALLAVRDAAGSDPKTLEKAVEGLEDALFQAQD